MKMVLRDGAGLAGARRARHGAATLGRRRVGRESGEGAEPLSPGQHVVRRIEVTRWRWALSRGPRRVGHPAIRYNASVASFTSISRWRPTSTSRRRCAGGRLRSRPRRSSKRRLYQKLLFGQIAELEVDCAEPGAEVLLDGERLFIGRAVSTGGSTPVPHQLAARKRRASSLRRRPSTSRPGGSIARPSPCGRFRALPVEVGSSLAHLGCPGRCSPPESRRPGGRALHGRRAGSARPLRQ